MTTGKTGIRAVVHCCPYAAWMGPAWVMSCSFVLSGSDAACWGLMHKLGLLWSCRSPFFTRAELNPLKSSPLKASKANSQKVLVLRISTLQTYFQHSFLNKVKECLVFDLFLQTKTLGFRMILFSLKPSRTAF